ncbi:MAG: glycoside hydrolase [Pseudomonadota bacterium]
MKTTLASGGAVAGASRRSVLMLIGGAALLPALPCAAAEAPLGAGEPVARWVEKADALTPALVETEQPVLQLVRAVAASDTPLLWRMDTEAPAEALATRTLKKGDQIILDFGGHRTGYLSYRLETEGREPDAPARLKFTFGEVPSDVAEEFYPYHGSISSSWLPDEIVNIDYLPQAVRMPRRYAFRYVKIEVLDTSPGFSVRFLDVRAHAVTSARNAAPSLPASKPALRRRIDEVAIATLRDCMQTCFEDGPRRDQRLWVGDLRLQALTNYVTFRQNDLVKRCLYLFAAHPRSDGLVAACVYEKPRSRYGGLHIVDYAALYNVALADYVDATGDVETGRELWPVAKRQLELLGANVDAGGLYQNRDSMWIFIDWSDALDRAAAIQGVLIFAYQRSLDLARKLGLEAETADYPAQIARMTAGARAAFWDAHAGVFVSGPQRQVSWASQAWMTIAGVASRAEARAALRHALVTDAAVKPGTPYLNHYFAEALVLAGLRREAQTLIDAYWGGMVRAGADTFWEAYQPTNPLLSPYGDRHINSYCHAWSCTPAYLFRAYDLA